VSTLTFVPIERVACPSYEEFFHRYDRPQRPVVITDATRGWRASTLWSHRWFQERHGSTEVHLSLEKTHTRRAASMSLARYIDLILGGADGGLYMDQFPLERIPSLATDFSTPYVNPNRRNVNLNLWLGPAGTFISLHKDNHNSFDHTNNVFAQIRGRKRVVLVSPEQDALMYPRSREQGAWWHSQVDWENPDFDRFPLFRNVRLLETTLLPGELIFIPGNYWHSLRSLDPSISLSCWWRVHRIADVVVTALQAPGESAGVNNVITSADVSEFGGLDRRACALESGELPEGLCELVRSLLEPMVRRSLENRRYLTRTA
jgi:Cupin-like domain